MSTRRWAWWIAAAAIAYAVLEASARDMMPRDLPRARKDSEPSGLGAVLDRARQITREAAEDAQA